MRLFFFLTLLAASLSACGAADSSTNTLPATALPIAPTVATMATPTQAVPTIAAPTKEPVLPRPNNLTPLPGVVPSLPTPGAPVGAILSGVVLAPPYDSGMQRFITTATSDLGQRLGVDQAAIEVVEVRSVVWPDSGMGCPQPGMNYTQVLVDGLFIQLRANDQTYNYHSGNNRGPFLCK
ncbi:MAG: hypothetical protein SH847_21670 [Roseiflexaceae bacterium]|nr:hypothetical protein [Roseiflexaceae bacterium]